MHTRIYISSLHRVCSRRPLLTCIYCSTFLFHLCIYAPLALSLFVRAQTTRFSAHDKALLRERKKKKNRLLKKKKTEEETKQTKSNFLQCFTYYYCADRPARVDAVDFVVFRFGPNERLSLCPVDSPNALHPTDTYTFREQLFFLQRFRSDTELVTN